MAQRNTPCTSQVIDSDSNQQEEGYVFSDPCIFLGDIRNFPLPDVQVGIAALGNTASLEAHPPPEHYDRTVFYGIPQYPAVQHQHHVPNLDLVVGPPSNFYTPYLAAPSNVSINHGSMDQVPSSSNYMVMGVSADEYGRNCHLVDDLSGSYNKRKNFEGIPGNFQYFSVPSIAGSSMQPFNARYPDGVAAVDAAAYNIHQYRGNGPSFRELGLQRSVRNRAGVTSMEPIMGQNPNYFQANYISQHYYPAIDGTSSTWSSTPTLSYMQGSNIGCPVDNVSRSSTHLLSSAANLRHPNIYHPSPHIQGVRAQNINPHPQVAAVSPQVPVSIASQGALNRSQDGLGVGLRYRRPSAPSGLRVYRSHQEGVLAESNPRHRSIPQLRVLPPDGVAILEFPEFYEEVNFIDHHRDMRLDIEDMSYEELLALGERIGHVNTGLSEETVSAKLKTRTYSTSTLCINLEEAAPTDQEIDSCIICQEDFKKEEEIGVLDCGHEYHADCLKKWLLVKNACPICKCEALATDKTDGA